MKKQTWFFVGLFGILLGAANPTVIRWVSSDISMFAFNTLRFGVIALVCLPFIIANLGKLNKRALKSTLIASVSIAISVVAFTEAIKMSQVSYASIISLLSPIILVLLSVKLMHERVKMRGLIGITLAALGAMVVVVMPIAFGHGSFTFYPLATVLAALNAVCYPISTIYSREANVVHKISMPALIGMTSIVVVVSNFVLWQTVDGARPVEWNLPLLGAILYSGVVVALVSRAICVFTYEHIGAAQVAPLTYMESIITILLPVFVLGESLSIYMILGGVLILVGTIVVEYHRSTHHKHVRHASTR